MQSEINSKQLPPRVWPTGDYEFDIKPIVLNGLYSFFKQTSKQNRVQVVEQSWKPTKYVDGWLPLFVDMPEDIRAQILIFEPYKPE